MLRNIYFAAVKVLSRDEITPSHSCLSFCSQRCSSNSSFRALAAVHTSMMAAPSQQVRSLYRSILRELPHRPLSNPSPIQQLIRHSFSSDYAGPHQLQEAVQYLHYAKAQRMYATLLERYNPGMSMDEEEKVRLTARRVGMDLPEDLRPGGKKQA